MELVRKITSLGLAARKKAGIKVRQPLNTLYVISEKLNLNKELLNLAEEEINVKKIEVKSKGFRLNKQNLLELTEDDLKVILDTEITFELRSIGWVREIIRTIQEARKDANYKYDQKVRCFWFTEDKDLKEAILRNLEFIKTKTILKEIKESRHDPKFSYDIERELEIESGRKIWIGLVKG
jgi:isoleucyl-tRNA synthetase